MPRRLAGERFPPTFRRHPTHTASDANS